MNSMHNITFGKPPVIPLLLSIQSIHSQIADATDKNLRYSQQHDPKIAIIASAVCSGRGACMQSEVADRQEGLAVSMHLR